MNFRSAIDTFYFGLRFDDFEVNDVVEKIKKNLSFLRGVNWNVDFCRNRFYRYELVSEENGFYMFGSPRGKTHNPTLTIQLGGLFFRRKDSVKFINFLFDNYFGLIEFQRLDVCLDVIYTFDDFKKMDFDKDTGVIGFPFPTYSETWKNRRIDFDMYSRVSGDSRIINMVSQGKDDFRMRVYDKTLELLENHKTSYEKWYEIAILDVAQVYRLEIQLRGDKLKSFVEQCNCSNDNIKFLTYHKAVFNCLTYLFYKYDFRYLDKNKFMLENFDASLNHKTESTLEGRMHYAKQMFTKYYLEYCRLYDEYLNFLEESKELDSHLKIFNKCFVPPDSLKDSLVTGKDSLELDLYKEFKQMNLPF